jgi:hypothetical protein
MSFNKTDTFETLRLRQLLVQNPDRSFPAVGSLLVTDTENGHTVWTQDICANSVTLNGPMGDDGTLTYDGTNLLVNGVPVGGGGGGPTGPTGPRGYTGPIGPVLSTPVLLVVTAAVPAHVGGGYFFPWTTEPAVAGNYLVDLEITFRKPALVPTEPTAVLYCGLNGTPLDFFINVPLIFPGSSILLRYHYTAILQGFTVGTHSLLINPNPNTPATYDFNFTIKCYLKQLP